MAKRDIIAVGGSTGSTAVLKTLMSGLPADFPGALFVTVHLPIGHASHLAEILGAAGPLPVSWAIDGQPIEPGHVYLAPPDRHLLLLDATLRLGAGSLENMARPSIDPMFRSAALSFGPRAVGVILSGQLDDGAAGLNAIKQMGGCAIVQSPLDAVAPGMPSAALLAADGDHCVPSADLAALLRDVVMLDAGPPIMPADSLLFEVEVALGARLDSETLRRFAGPRALTCPDCGGVLSEVRGERPLRSRCQTGHAFTAEHPAGRHELVDEAIRVAMRVMEERVELVERMAADARRSGRSAVADLY